MAGTYLEITGRVSGRTPGKVFYTTIGAAATSDDEDIPVEGDTLSSPDITHTLPAVCVSVEIDENRYAGRVMVTARYQALITEAEV